MLISRIVAAGLALSACCTTLLAQDGENTLPNRPADSRAREPYQPTWSSPEIAQVAQRLIGSWRTVDAIDSMPGEDGQPVQVYLVMSIAPAPVEGMTDTLYVETARTDSPWNPYRRAIFQIFPYKDGHRLRTLEMAIGEGAGVFDGMFAATEYFPQLAAEDLIATIDLDITPTDTGFTGATPYPYPTRIGGAVEMTSAVTLDGESMVVRDRGFNADGEIVWGADDDGFLFERGQGVVSTTRRDDGMVILDYGGASGPVVSNGDQMHVHYEGYLADATQFDASYDRGQPFVFPFPPGSRAITGWGLGMEGFAEGAHRKLVIPGDLGYGPAGNPRAGIPADATLYFNVHLVQVDRPQAPAEPAEDAAGGQTGEGQTGGEQ